MANSEDDLPARDDTLDVEQYPQGRDTSFEGPAGELGGDRELGATDSLGDTPVGQEDPTESQSGDDGGENPAGFGT